MFAEVFVILSDVSSKIRSCEGCKIALFTFMFLHASVNQGVSLQRSGTLEPQPTLDADKVPLSHMLGHVVSQLRLGVRQFPTNFTFNSRPGCNIFAVLRKSMS